MSGVRGQEQMIDGVVLVGGLVKNKVTKAVMKSLLRVMSHFELHLILMMSFSANRVSS